MRHRGRLIDAARAAFDALTPAQQNLVTNYATLTDAEAAYLLAGGFVVENGVLTAYVGEGGDIVIPDVVKEIGTNAFSSCESLTGVIVPDSVTTIGDNAFSDCANLQSVTFKGDAPTNVGEGAFDNVPATCAVFVQPGSTGWGDVPGTWQGLQTWFEGSVFRFYSKAYKGHFFTIDEAEKNDIEANNPNWNFEGIAYRAFLDKAPGTTALYRFYSKGYRGHFFTIDAEEAEIVKTNPNWKYEGIAYYIYPTEIEGSVPVFRFWSKAYRHHFYTTNEAEKDDLIAHNPNWKYEGIAFYALPEEETGRAANRGAPGSRALPAADGARGETALPDESFTEAAWTLSAKDGAAVAVPGTTEIGGVVVETRADAPDAGELEAGGAGVSPSGELALLLTLPGGAFDATLWSAAEGTVAEETDVEGAFDFDLPADGVWHWLRVRDAVDEDAFSVWLRAE